MRQDVVEHVPARVGFTLQEHTENLQLLRPRRRCLGTPKEECVAQAAARAVPALTVRIKPGEFDESSRGPREMLRRPRQPFQGPEQAGVRRGAKQRVALLAE